MLIKTLYISSFFLFTNTVILNIENDIKDKNFGIFINVHPISKSISDERVNIKINTGEVLELFINKGTLKKSRYYRFIFDSVGHQGSFNIKTSDLLEKFNNQRALSLGFFGRLLPFEKVGD